MTTRISVVIVGLALIAPVSSAWAQFVVDEDFSGGALGALTASGLAAAPTFPGGGVVELGERATAGVRPLVVASGLPTNAPFITVEADMLAVPGCPGCYDHGVYLGDVRFVFHPGWPGNANQGPGGPQLASNTGAASPLSSVTGDQMTGNVQLGFTPTDTSFIRVTATVTPNADGADNDDFDITLLELGGAGESFTFDTYRTQNAADWVLTGASEFGYHRSGDDAFPSQLDRVLITDGGGTGTPTATTFTWNEDGVGDWAVQDNWSFSGLSPAVRANNANHTAIFGGLIGSPTTVATNAAVTVNRIDFDNATNGYVVSGHGSVNMAATTSAGPLDPTMSVLGTHEFQAAVNLLTDTTVTVASDSTLIFNNALDLNNNVLNKTGTGELAIRNDFLTSGGTLNCDEGTCSGSGTISGDVNNDGGTISPGNSSGSQSVIPEPTTLLLVMIGSACLFAFRRTFRRKR